MVTPIMEYWFVVLLDMLAAHITNAVVPVVVVMVGPVVVRLVKDVDAVA
jgi:hypothetical protein